MLHYVFDTFQTIKLQHEADFMLRYSLVVKTGIVKGDAVIKLLKPHWTTSPMHEIMNSNGVFFSVWLDETKPAKPLLRYSLEAPQLRNAGYPKINAHQFAQHVRENGAFANWPDVSFPKGPVIVFRGSMSFVPASLVLDATNLLRKFAEAAPVVDVGLKP